MKSKYWGRFFYFNENILKLNCYPGTPYKTKTMRYHCFSLVSKLVLQYMGNYHFYQGYYVYFVSSSHCRCLCVLVFLHTSKTLFSHMLNSLRPCGFWHTRPPASAAISAFSDTFFRIFLSQHT